MGVVVYGRRAYGRVHAHGGEYADTQFGHIDFVPLFPVQSFWVTRDLGDGRRMGFPIKLHAQSVAATYLRVWGPAIALIVLAASSSVTALIVAIALGALSAWSWTWRGRRGRALRRSDFDRVALGSRCAPAWMRDDMRDELASRLQAALAKRDDARPPDDVARFGARDLDEAVLAYGLLRVHGARHRGADAAADQLLDQAFEQLPSDGGPYREAIAGTVPELGAAIRAAAQAHADAAIASRSRRWFHRPWVQLAGLVLATPMLAAAIGVTVQSFGPPRMVDAAQLDSSHPPLGHRVRVRCDRVEDPGWQVVDGTRVREAIVFCWIGDHLLPIASSPELASSATIQDGELRLIPDRDLAGRHPWVDALHDNADLDARSYAVYLRLSSGDRAGIVIAWAFALGVAIGWVLWIRALVIRRRRVRG